MKHIQVIDGAVNSTFDVFEVPDGIFRRIFSDGTDVAFLAEVEQRLGVADDRNFWQAVYGLKVDKKSLLGIHGTLHLTGSQCHPDFFPKHRESYRGM